MHQLYLEINGLRRRWISVFFFEFCGGHLGIFTEGIIKRCLAIEPNVQCY